MDYQKAGKARGVINKKIGEQVFYHERYLPSNEIAYFVEHYWLLKWDLRNQSPYVAEVLAHPSIHVVWQTGQSYINGIVSGKFERKLEDKGEVFGIKFKPGAFYPLYNHPISELTDNTLPVEAIFDVNVPKIESELFALMKDMERIAYIEKFLLPHLPEHDPKIELVNHIIQHIKFRKQDTSVEDIAAQFHMSRRTLERLFQQYIGISPKWVMMRYRLHDVLEKTEQQQIDWTTISYELGYYDQSHFIKDFKAVLGMTPEDYLSITK